MKVEKILVIYDGRTILLYPEVAAIFNIKDGYTIKSEAEFWQILGANAHYGAEIMKVNISKIE